MSGTLTVRELITELLNYDMEENVYIGLGPDGLPSGASEIQRLVEYHRTAPGGIYLIPQEHLVDASKEAA